MTQKLLSFSQIVGDFSKKIGENKGELQQYLLRARNINSSMSLST